MTEPKLDTPADPPEARTPGDLAEAILNALNAREVLSRDHANALWWALGSMQPAESQSLLVLAKRMSHSVKVARDQVEAEKRYIRLQEGVVESLRKAIKTITRGEQK